jgi:hypothetical protein
MNVYEYWEEERTAAANYILTHPNVQVKWSALPALPA